MWQPKSKGKKYAEQEIVQLLNDIDDSEEFTVREDNFDKLSVTQMPAYQPI